MPMACRKVESVDESIAIHVCFTDSLTFYERLRFGLEASPFFTRPLGIFLWRILHVLLLFLAPPLVALVTVATLVFSAFLDLLTIPIWLLFGVGLIVVCSTLMGLLLVCVAVENLCWLVKKCAWAGDPWVSMLQIWKKFARPVMGHFLLLREGCLSWKILKDFRTEWSFLWCGVCLRRWWEEVVHSHYAIAI